MSMTYDDAIEELRNRDDLPEIRDELEARENVHGTGIGYRYKNGERTDEAAVMAFVSEKPSEEELPDSEIIPEEINGVPIDVYDDGREPEEERADTRDEELRPIPGGCRVAAYNSNSTLVYIGTCGLGVYDDANAVESVLIAGHSAENDDDTAISDIIGRSIYQISTEFGTVNQCEYDPLDGSGKDYAVVGLTDATHITTEVLGVGQAGSFMEPSFDEPIVVPGGTSNANGVRKAELLAIDAYASGRGPCIHYTDVTEGGDSGTPVGQFDSDGVFRPCGIHIIGGSYALRLDDIMSRANLSHVSGSYDDPSHTLAPYFEGSLIYEDTERGIGTANVWNAGDPTGGVEFTRVEIRDDGGAVVDSKVLAIAGNERRTVDVELPDNGEYTFHTADITHPHDSRATVSTIDSIATYEPGVYVRENGEWVLKTHSST